MLWARMRVINLSEKGKLQFPCPNNFLGVHNGECFMLEMPCSVCGKVYPVSSEFYPMDKRRNCRNSAKCWDCHNEHERKKYSEHPESSIRYRETHREELLEKKKQYYLNNKEHCNKKSKEYYEKHKIETKRFSDIWRKNHPEKIKQYTRLRYERHKEHMLVVAQSWKDRNRDAVNTQWQRREAKKKALKATLTKAQWESIKKEFNNRCAYCGEETKLTQDHFVPVSRDGEYTANNIIPACSKCNCSKFNNSFFEWYPNSLGYSKERERRILNYLGYDKATGLQQLRFDEIITEHKP